MVVMAETSLPASGSVIAYPITTSLL